MGILNSAYYYDLYAQKAAEECNSLEVAMDGICSECGEGYEIVAKYVQMHDKDEDFQREVSELSYTETARLFLILLQSDYNIFVPWLKREVLELLKEDPEALSWTEQDYQRSIQNWYDYYKKDWDEVEETLD